MKLTDAANLLGLTGTLNPDLIKSAYRAAARRYHPDRNPAGAEMMKMINAAYETLKDFTGEIGNTPEEGHDANYPEAVSQALNIIIDLDGIVIEICGAWVWVSGETFRHRTTLKEAGFRFASKKKRWYFRPEDWVSSSRGSFSMGEIRDKYGSTRPPRRQRDLLEEEAHA